MDYVITVIYYGYINDNITDITIANQPDTLQNITNY